MYYDTTREMENQVDTGKKVRDTLRKAVTKKAMNERTVSYLRKLNMPERANRMEQCGNYIEFTGDKITSANFCRDRVCAVCAWRRHLKMTAQAQEVIKQIHTDGYVFMTLTVKSVTAAEISDEITKILMAFRRLTKTIRWERAYQGYMRGLEVTYNRHKCTYHPHIHVLLPVRDGYYTDNYITQRELCKMWRKALGVKYNPVVDIRGVDDNKWAALEVSKYAMKTTDWTYSLGVLQVMMDALAGRRLVGYGGVWRKLRMALQQMDVEDDVSLVDDDGVIIDNAAARVVYQYIPTSGGFYEPYELPMIL